MILLLSFQEKETNYIILSEINIASVKPLYGKTIRILQNMKILGIDLLYVHREKEIYDLTNIFLIK